MMRRGALVWVSFLIRRRGTFFAPMRNAHNDRNNSNNDELTSTHFDIQDIDVNRLTHHYWEHADSPYDDLFLMDEALPAEGGMDTAVHILPQDRPLLSKEYL